MTNISGGRFVLTEEIHKKSSNNIILGSMKWNLEGKVFAKIEGMTFKKTRKKQPNNSEYG